MDVLSNIISMIKVNGLRKKEKFSVKLSKKILLFVECLYNEGFITGYKVNGVKIDVFMKYDNDGLVIRDIKRVSKFSNRVYMSFSRLKKEAKKNRFYIISSDKGLLYTKNYKLLDNFVGGEVLCLLG